MRRLPSICPLKIYLAGDFCSASGLLRLVYNKLIARAEMESIHLVVEGAGHGRVHTPNGPARISGSRSGDSDNARLAIRPTWVRSGTIAAQKTNAISDCVYDFALQCLSVSASVAGN
jgi:hypothetical protein